VTPDLVASFSSKAIGLGLGHLYAGTRLTPDDPLELASNAIALEDALAITVQQSFELDGAEAVIIGGGPLGQAAVGLAPRFKIPVIAPISTAVEQLLRHMADRSGNMREACS
jgi:Asp/Glu/hydantoin racemase